VPAVSNAPPHGEIAAKAGSDTGAHAAKHDETVAVDNKPVEAEKKPAESTIEAAKVDAKPEEPKAESAKPDDSAKAVGPDAKKDQARLANASMPVVTKPELPKRAGQISAFISRKDSKLYVRQNFAPLFDVPITIAASDRPLGTHVFTAEADKKDGNILHWSAVSLPLSARSIQRSADEERFSRHRKLAAAGPVAMKALPVPDSAAEALDRITIPADAMARVTEALTTGSSIIVSDQGINQGETGEGTDFIVSLR